MKAVIPVGGTGTRLRPLTLTVPKQVLPIVEVPMIERVLAHVASHGVDEAVLSLGYLHDAFATLFPEGYAGPVALTFVEKSAPSDAGPSLVSAGTYVLSRRCSTSFLRANRASIERQVFPALAGKGSVYGFDSRGVRTLRDRARLRG